MNPFLSALFADATGFLEIRSFPGPVQRFLPLPVDDFPDLDEMRDHYFGVAPRVRRSGTEADVAQIHALWLDVDTKCFADKPAALKRLHDWWQDAAYRQHGPLGPSIIVDSGHGYHAYWLLDAPIAPADGRALMDALRLAVNPDLDSTSDPPRILRVPDTWNRKDAECLEVKVVHFEPEWRYRAETLSQALGSRVAALDGLATGGPQRARAASGPSDGAIIPEGQRNAALARMAGHARQGGHDRESIAALLHAVNERRCSPPLPAPEVARIAASVARYEPVQALQAMLEDWAGQDGQAKTLAALAVMVNVSEVAPVPVRWLWPGRIALGKLTILAGDPGLGKSFLTLEIAARVSRGARWPEPDSDGANPNSAGGTLLLSAEDDIADTIRPRLDAAGAAVERIAVLQAVRRGNGQKFFDLGTDLAALDEAISSVDDCRLVVVDPISAYLGAVDSHNNAEVRAMLAPLADLAAKHAVAVLAVTHLRKGSGKAIYRAMGSLAFTAAARAAYAVARDPKDQEGTRRLFLPIKNNLGPDVLGLAYRLDASFSTLPVVVWEDKAVSESADSVLDEEPKHRGPSPTERNQAAEWLQEALANGPRPARDLYDEAGKVGINDRTLRRAKRALGVQDTSRGVWQLSSGQVIRHSAT